MTEVEKIFGTRAKMLFWEAKLSEIDLQVHSRYVIERALEYGDFNQLRELFKLYGTDEIRKTVRISRALSRRTKVFWGKIFDLEEDTEWQQSLKIHSEFWIR